MRGRLSMTCFRIIIGGGTATVGGGNGSGSGSWKQEMMVRKMRS